MRDTAFEFAKDLHEISHFKSELRQSQEDLRVSLFISEESNLLFCDYIDSKMLKVGDVYFKAIPVIIAPFYYTIHHSPTAKYSDSDSIKRAILDKYKDSVSKYESSEDYELEKRLCDSGYRKNP